VANAVNGNTIKIDTTGTISLTGKNFRVSCIVVTSSATGAIFELDDPATAGDVEKIRIEIAAANTVEALDLSRTPIVFPNGIKVKTVTNCEATIIFSRVGSG